VARYPDRALPGRDALRNHARRGYNSVRSGLTGDSVGDSRRLRTNEGRASAGSITSGPLPVRSNPRKHLSRLARASSGIDTEAGTLLLFTDPTFGFAPINITAVGSGVFFSARANAAGQELTANGLKQRDIAWELDITQAVQRAAAVGRRMAQLGTGDAYLPLTAPPDDDDRLRRHRHPRYRFEPLPPAVGQARST